MHEDIIFDDPEREVLELTDYEIEREKPMPNRLHAFIQTRLVISLDKRHGKKYDVATELTVDTPGKATTPDVVIMEKRPLDYFDDSPRETIPPLVAIEIVSASQGFSIFKEKAERYFAFGVRSFWIVQPYFREIYVFSSPRQYQTFLHTDILKDGTVGVELPLSEIFI